MICLLHDHIGTSLLASLFAPFPTTKFNRILTGFTLSTFGLLTNVTNATQSAFKSILLVFVILFNLLCEESVKDLVEQLGSGGFSEALVLLLGRMPNGLTSFSLPFSQDDPCQLDQVPHVVGQEDGLLVTIPSLIIILYLFHHKLGSELT